MQQRFIQGDQPLGIKNLTRYRVKIRLLGDPFKIATKASFNRVVVVATTNGEPLGEQVISVSK